jgi:hypothetical protein
MLAQAERLIAAAIAAKLVIQERFIGLPRFCERTQSVTVRPDTGR